ncbi:SDR family oxidoreductase [Sphingomicrobium sediminis]|uniref:SDR family oxidoreductase n=1 Tax=Sphingomicrobium sediminis TaxID=2950949 RepID=A0A9X2J3W9_9SPHN|nr:SDR family oxidoreductase [Sphingomicrobium sediminis]MCM8558520.1 SDR family oxidoreductase [Sphingomicrobium sediminis]
MSDFSNAIVIGQGGIGGAIADAIEARGGRVTRLGRQTTPPIDFLEPATIEAAASALEAQGPFDAVIIASGILHSDAFGPEKSWRMLDADPLTTTFAINTIGPALVARHFIPLLPRKERFLFAALSARVGSISDNRIGGWYGYRASKAALNQIIRTLAIELGRTHKEGVIAALHPGTVDTKLSEPFQGNVPDKQLFSPEKSANHLLDVLSGLTPEDSGGHFDWAGEPVPA